MQIEAIERQTTADLVVEWIARVIKEHNPSPEALELDFRFHRRLIDIADHDADSAERSMREHMEIVRLRLEKEALA